MLKLNSYLETHSESAWERFEEASEVSLTEPQQQALRALFAVSPFIAGVAERYPHQLLADFFANDGAIAIDDSSVYESKLNKLLSECDDDRRAKYKLREYRHCVMAKLAAADILGQLSITEALKHFSTFPSLPKEFFFT